MALIKFPPSYVSKIQGKIEGFSGPPDEAIVAGQPLESQFVGEALAAIVAVKVTTELEVFAKWQVALDGEEWADVLPCSAVPIAIGDGEKATSVTKLLTAPEGVRAGNRLCRVALFCRGDEPARGIGVDEGSIAYEFRAPLIAAGP